MLTDCCTVPGGPTTLLADMDKTYSPVALYWCVTVTSLGNFDKNALLVSEKKITRCPLVIHGLIKARKRMGLCNQKVFPFLDVYPDQVN